MNTPRILADVMAEVDTLARRSQIDPRAVELTPAYYERVAPEDLLDRTPADLLGAVVSHLHLARERPVGTAAVEIHTPDDEGDGWSLGRTVIEIVTDDMPFLVDSVSAALTAIGESIRLVIHPVFAVQRDAAGHLQDVLAEDEPEVGHDIHRESWIHVEIDRRDADTAAIEHEVRQVLLNVREAVEDWPRMRERALRIADEMVTTPPSGIDRQMSDETAQLLEWMVADHFTFIGYREYDLVGPPGDESLQAVPGTGLGILRSDQPATRAFARLSPEVRALAREPVTLVLTKANSRSTVHRRTYLDYVGVKRFDESGKVVGERRFLGLYSASAYAQSVWEIPVVRRRVENVFAAAGVERRTHTGKSIEHFLETYPREEMFSTPSQELAETALAVYHIAERRQTRLFWRRDPYGRFVSCLVYLPRDRYTTAVRLRIQGILRDALGVSIIDHTARVSDSSLARLHFVVRAGAGEILNDADHQQVEQRIIHAARSWEDEFNEALIERFGTLRSAGLLTTYRDAFPEGYKEDFTPRTASIDVEAIENELDESGIHLHLYEPIGEDATLRRLKVFRAGEPISLTAILPVLTSLGVDVIDERPYEIERTDSSPVWIYDFGMIIGRERLPERDSLADRFAEAFLASWDGRAAVDDLNSLVLNSGLTYRQVLILRAYARYLRQSGASFAPSHIESALLSHMHIATSLVALFEARFDPVRSLEADDRRAHQVATITDSILGALEGVARLDEDRILRALMTMINATLRTNYYQRDANGSPRELLTLKLDPRSIDVLPEPRPEFEIWAYSPRVEGVHLRFGHVARGGLRWSDRPADFRTEVLGLVKAQQVKNAVIVPVGAKGGFVPQRLPDPALDRAAWLEEGRGAYAAFIAGMLDVTDNVDDGKVVPPDAVVRHDGDDPYLVVAADKGTATFSDLANSVAQRYGFWLGDAFASGGSEGYDHKAMGITARGAWESVKRHFRELGVNTQAEEFTVVGIGDMSGDVFGNGMLLSPHIRLVAAFDHRHIFIDPQPDCAVSYAERQRLFDLPRSSWADYNIDLISTGGGVFRRTSKSIPITDPMRRVLGIDPGVTALEPNELIRALLRAPVDLLWNGGIGTYVKAQSETDAQVGDKANDAVRIDGGQMRCLVVGEGGNLGLTQAGRVEAARAGVRLNTDAIDNSAGVDTSDHEVNIKILLDEAVRAGEITTRHRNDVLAQMTDDVAAHVLKDNYDQNVLLGNARRGAPRLLAVHGRMIRDLQGRGLLDRALEDLPTDEEISTRQAAGQGLTSPELAVLAAYSKIALAHDLGSSISDDPWFAMRVRDYFPGRLQEEFATRIDTHPLKDGIVTTLVVNQVVNHGGITLVFRGQEETGATVTEIVRAAATVASIFDLHRFWNEVNALDDEVPTQAQSALHLEGRRLLDRGLRWFLNNRGQELDVGAEVSRFAPVIRTLTPHVVGCLRGIEHERFEKGVNRFVELGSPLPLAEEASAMLDVFALLDIAEIAERTDSDPLRVLDVYFALSERYGVDRFLGQITELSRGDRWSALARQALRSDLYSALASFTAGVMSEAAETDETDALIESWESHHQAGLSRARTTLEQIASQESADLAMLSVALRIIRTLVTQSGS